MLPPKILTLNSVPQTIFSELDIRDVSLWIADDPTNSDDLSALANLSSLPWRNILCELNSKELIDLLQLQEDISAPMVRRRGFKHVISDNPADIRLPPRSLPIFFLNGLPDDSPSSFSARTRRQNMLTELLRAPIRSLVILGIPSPSVRQDIGDLWDEGFRPTIYVVSPSEDARSSLDILIDKPASRTHGVITLSSPTFGDIVSESYLMGRSDRDIIRIRDASGEPTKLDISSIDNPERPILSPFQTIFDVDLYPLLSTDLLPDEIQDFFENSKHSWRPFAAGLPYLHDTTTFDSVIRTLRGMEREKADRLRVQLVSAEDGAGATTLLRALCWKAASTGFPVLLARDNPMIPDADEVSAYLSRINVHLTNESPSKTTTVHEVPWLLAFDRGIWDGHEDDLAVFARRLETLGRQVVIVVVTGPFLPIPFYDTNRFEKLTNLTHIIPSAIAEELGSHLNEFLSRIGAQKSIDQWRAFLRDTTSHSDGRQSAFWVVLSFWLRGRFNLQETFDSWVYNQFRNNISDLEVVQSLVKMAALATERTAMPYALLPPTKDFPVSSKLSDAQSAAPALGIIMLGNGQTRYWTILHQTVADALLRGFFYDNESRNELGYCTAANPTHLALLVLADISQDPRLAHLEFQVLAERFATHIFKIDPERGYGRFAPYWREVISALEGMPALFRKSNRAFLHHTAISRRRIARDVDAFPIDNGERAGLLEDAIQELSVALSIPPSDTAEGDLNLYNSLARAYYDLANVKMLLGEGTDVIYAIQKKAEEATFNAYRLNPNNSYVVETYAENLLVNGGNDRALAGRYALEVLALVYSILERDETHQRRYALTKLADRAFELLIVSAEVQRVHDPADPVDAIQIALRPLVTFEDRFEGMHLKDYPRDIRQAVAQGLAEPVLSSNPQAVKLHYILTCIDQADDFALQLSLLSSLGDVEGIVTPQMLLERAVLLFQNGRYFQGTEMFGRLRRMWRARTHFVEVPERLHWLIDPNTRQRRQVRARVVERGDFRSFAAVEEFGNETAVFRPREFHDSGGSPGSLFSALVSFGHNGPFLRPLTAR